MVYWDGLWGTFDGLLSWMSGSGSGKASDGSSNIIEDFMPVFYVK